MAAALEQYYEGGTPIFAAWDVVNQFTPLNELQWDESSACYNVTEAQEAVARDVFLCLLSQQRSGGCWCNVRGRLVGFVCVSVGVLVSVCGCVRM